MDHNFTIFEENEPSAEFLSNKRHQLKVWLTDNGHVQDVYLDFSSRLAMLEFGKSLIHEALFGESGMQERHPQSGDVVSSVRLTEESARLFVFYETDSPVPG